MAIRRLVPLLAALAVLVLALFALALSVAPGLAPFGESSIARVTLPEARPYEGPGLVGSGDDSAPLVVIDAGHGGFDYGARAEGFDEKTIALGLAQALRDRLVSDGRYRVAMTRDDDSFVSLTERFRIARRMGADLFISIHADSAGASGDTAEAVTGASIYTLSDKASSAAARRFASRENSAAQVNGQDMEGQSDVVASILVDLSQRRTMEQSAKLASLIESEGQGILRFHKRPLRTAVLEVLRAPDVPSVLFESGYITNPQEAQRLSSVEGKRAFATVMARAIRLYFASERQGQASPSPIASGAVAP
ncbi:N-acetylmuramoyl-L-alanine amidase [Qipengyuania sp.]|uniref:N-acetylmuramoyl-L-alanine amidase family protein n=1 Tax=Qipengyuania sp. TaxID=2004515 RepID=UPI0035C833C1